MADSFDLVVIGAGPAGEKAATQAAYFGKRVAVVERRRDPGGTVVSDGGVPTKTLRETAEYLTGFRHRDVYGITLALDADMKLQRLRARMGEVRGVMTEAVRANLARMQVTLVQGEAKLLPGRVVEVRTPGGATRHLQAEVVLLATGSHPVHPPGVPFDDPGVSDSERILQLRELPRRLVVIGGGAVGCEYASIFTALGVEVTLVEAAGRLLPFLDAEVATLYAAVLGKLGTRVLLGQPVSRIAREGGELTVTLPAEVLPADHVLFAGGRRGNVEGLGLAEAGVAVDALGRITVDADLRTTAAGVYAAGDVIGPPALASVSMEQGRVAACHAFGVPFKDVVDPLPPFGVYSIPEVAMVGLSEEAARERGVDYAVGRGFFEKNTRARISGATEGLVKLVFRRADHVLVGVHVLGDVAAEIVHLGQMAISLQRPIDYFIHATFNVPTYTEAYKYAAYDGLQALKRS